ncbi:MAG: D-alanine--D-alanine ligase [Nakamurella sp.]
MTLRVLHLVGSAVSEFLSELSLVYARDCLEFTADQSRYEFHIALISPDGRWRFPADLSPDSIGSAIPMSLAPAIEQLTGLNIDVVVPQMFCIPGMTSYRALFDVLRIPYLGNKPDVMALAANKALARAVVAGAGVPVPAGEVLRRGQRPTTALPAVVKPVDGDNSLGVTLVRNDEDYDSALTAAFAYSDQVLVESFVELGREVRCGIVVRDGQLICLPLEEYNVDSVARPIRNHHDKIDRNSAGELNLVAKDTAKAWIVHPGDPLTQRVWEMAVKCHIALGARHYSLFDFRIDPAGQPWFLEAGLYCSFARKSVISVMAKAAGIPLEDLFRHAIEQSKQS